ncbi:hypothetical protein [Rhizobium leguminosarum]|uniref:hypothetical protein n=1 Tax=Rhizobium leguminosarum TaxID=384 RepID=UPI003F9B131D
MKHAILVFALSACFLSHPAVAQTAECPVCGNQTVPSNCPINFDDTISMGTYRVNGCSVRVAAPYGETRTAFCDANPPSGTLLFDYVARVTDANGSASRNISRIQGGADIDLERRITETYDAQEKIAIEMGDTKAAAEIAKMRKAHLEIVAKYKTNVDLVHAEVSATSDGDWYDKRGASSGIEISLDVICVAPTNLSDQIGEKIRRDVATAGIVINASSIDQWVYASVLEDPNTPCAQSTPPRASLVPSNSSPRRYELKIGGKDAKLCIMVSDKEATSAPDMKSACEFRAGGLLKLEDSTAYPCEF